MNKETATEGFPAEYFEEMIERDRGLPILPLPAKRCHECPINDMYFGISCDLGRCSEDVQMQVSQKWFCHTNPRNACKGNADNLGLNW